MSVFNFFKGQKKTNWQKTMPKDIANALELMIQNNSQACKTDEIPQGFGEFGLEKTNPIPVYGVPENEVYLSNLRQTNGERIRWRRVGSFKIENICSPIDEYEIFSLNGDTISFLYISPYHMRTSRKAPHGFKII